jgi:Ca2+-binding RTX toxin-like protein
MKILGNDNNEVLTGIAENDTIGGFGGNDQISGVEGDDIIVGGAGDDIISGGDGDDLLGGGKDNDVVAGGAGADFIYQSPGNDILSGEAGEDTFVFIGAKPLDPGDPGEVDPEDPEDPGDPGETDPDLEKIIADTALEQPFEQETIKDFEKGSDRILLLNFNTDFTKLDSNSNGILDDLDDLVAVGSDTVIDFSGEFGAAAGTHVLTVAGITNLESSDFIFG